MRKAKSGEYQDAQFNARNRNGNDTAPESKVAENISACRSGLGEESNSLNSEQNLERIRISY